MGLSRQLVPVYFGPLPDFGWNPELRLVSPWAQAHLMGWVPTWRRTLQEDEGSEAVRGHREAVMNGHGLG